MNTAANPYKTCPRGTREKTAVAKAFKAAALACTWACICSPTPQASAQTPKQITKAFPVENPSWNGFSIRATNQIQLVTPEGRIINTGEPFLSPGLDWRPTQPIQCAWSQNWVAIFVPHPRVTETFVFKLPEGRSLRRKFPEWTRPEWYNNALTIHDSPSGAWQGPNLPVKATALMADKNRHQLPMTLRVSTKDNSFAILPTPKQSQAAQNGQTQPTTQKPQKPQKATKQKPQKPTKQSYSWE
jgi:hypothetical protein